MQTLPIIDIHTHLAGLGQGGTNCFISPRKFDSILYKIMRWKLGIYSAHRCNNLDAAYLERLDSDVRVAAANKSLSAAVVFPHERIYLENGEVSPHGQELYVPNEYAFEVANRCKGRFLPAMSVHPYRKDALAESEKWIERGAVLMKWLPNSQGMDPRDKRCIPIYNLLAQKRIPLVAHTGGEHTVSLLRPELGSPEILIPALERGVTVIVAHCGTKSGLFDRHWMPEFLNLARRYPNCYGDTSAFTTPGRTRWIPRILREEGVIEKLVHGSDYPVPPTAWWSLWQIGWKRTRSIAKTWSFLQRDIEIKRAHGFPDIVFTNTARVLGENALCRWQIH